MRDWDRRESVEAVRGPGQDRPLPGLAQPRPRSGGAPGPSVQLPLQTG